MDKIDLFFEESSKLVMSNKNERQMSATDFNWFSITGVGHKEVPICAFIAELLKPDGSHCRGDFFLKSFLIKVIKLKNIDIYDLEKARVTTEEVINDKRRIDILIDLKKIIIPIEAKIYADDQENQLEDYLSFARKTNDKAIIYYLTLYGDEPTNKSKGELKEKQDYELVSFEKDIFDWLIEISKQQEIYETPRLYESIIQFLDIIRMLTNRRDGTLIEKMNGMISSPNDFETAKTISDSLIELEIKKLTEIYERIEKTLKDKFGKESLVSDYKDRIYNYYKKGTNTWPSINYILPPHKDAPKGEFVLRIENEWHLYFGVCNWDNKTSTNPHTVKGDINSQEKQNYILKSSQMNDNTMTDVFYWWDYLSEAKNYNFRNLNEGYENLFDQENFEEYIDVICKKIVSFIVKWNESI